MNNTTCRLIEVNLRSQEVKFQIKMKLSIVKCSISEAINELQLVSHLSAIEACYLGGHYGRMLWLDIHKSKITTTPNITMNFSLKNCSGRYQILYTDRAGNIGLYDTKLHIEFNESPISIVKNETLIKSLSSSQACYIGILAGFHFEKSNERNSKSDKPLWHPKKIHLTLVK